MTVTGCRARIRARHSLVEKQQDLDISSKILMIKSKKATHFFQIFNTLPFLNMIWKIPGPGVQSRGSCCSHSDSKQGFFVSVQYLYKYDVLFFG